MERHVTILRDFRDTCLLPCKLGRVIVKAYYRYSPPSADFIAKHGTLKAAVRIGLLPLVAVSYTALHFGMAVTATMVVSVFALLFILVSCYRISFWGNRING
jgi:hypothetical protein